MRSKKLVSQVSKTLAACRKAGGLLLVLAAVASPALAQDCGTTAPEIDPGALTSALTLLTGGALALADRFRR